MKKTAILLVILLFSFNQFTKGQNWETLNTGTTSRIYDIAFPPGQNSIGYAATGSGLYSGVGTIIKTENAGDTWEQIYPTSGTVDVFKSIFFTSVDTGYAGGLNDTFLKTTDGGATWTNITISTAGDIFHTIDFIDANNGIAVANPVATASSTIYVTDDAGTTWTIATGLTHGVYDLTYSNETTVFAVGHQDQSISRSLDGGNSWTLVNTGSPTFFLLGVDFAGDYGIAIGQFGDIHITTNGGDSWTYNNSIATSDNYQGIHVFNSDSTIFGGMNEKMYKTTDGGSTWVVEYDGPGSNYIYDIEFTDNGTGFAGLSNGNILRKTPPTSSGPELLVTPGTYVYEDTYVGQTASANFTFENIGTEVLNVTDITFTDPAFSIDYTAFPIQPGQSGELPVHFSPSASGFFEATMQIWSNDPINNPSEVELSGNGIVELIDGWEWINTGFDFILFDIQFPEGQNQIGYCVGESLTYSGDGIVIKTTDGGSTWTQLTPDGIPGLTGMSFMDINTGYAIGWDDYVIKTTDGGVTWDTLNVSNGMWSFQYDIEFFDENNGVVLAGIETFVTDDGGETWEAGDQLPTSCNMITFIKENTLTAVGNNNNIFKSIDGGFTWEVKNTGGDAVLLGVDFLNESYGMAAGDLGNIHITTDGGETWTLDTPVGDKILHAPFIWDEDTAWIVGTPEYVYKTIDGGTTWGSAYAGNWQKAFYRIIFTDNYTGFICGSGGVVLRKEGLPEIPAINVTPDNIIFDDTYIGVSNTEILTISNVGFASLEVTDITSTNNIFSVDLTSFNVEPGEEQEITVTFTPDDEGLFEGILEVENNDPENSLIEIAVSGTGLIANPTINVDPVEIVFDTTLVNEFSIEILTISNTGIATLNVTNIASSNTVFNVDITSFDLEPNESQEVEVTFTPNDQMLFEGVLQIESNDPISNIEVPVLGYGDIDTYISGINSNSIVNIYPNPAKNYLYLENIINYEIIIYDLFGNLKASFKDNTKIRKINISNYPEGIYIIKIIGINGITIKKIEIAK